MFYLGISGLITAYVLIAVLLLGIGIRSSWSWKIKTTAIIITTAFYLVTYYSWPRLLGWPSEEQPPQQFQLLAAYVERPDRQRGVSGAIYLWLTRIDDLSAPVVPRAYRFPYSVQLHERVLKATSSLNKGIAQLGEFEGGENGSTALNKNVSGSGEKSVNMIFYDLPDTMFPEH
ncbi:MAG: hypothetical protein ACRESK_06670 [Gammaproteobacteria bacterium]